MPSLNRQKENFKGWKSRTKRTKHSETFSLNTLAAGESENNSYSIDTHDSIRGREGYNSIHNEGI